MVGDVRWTAARSFRLGLKLGLGLGGGRNGKIIARFRGMREMEADEGLVVERGKACGCCGGGREKGGSNCGGHGSGIETLDDCSGVLHFTLLESIK